MRKHPRTALGLGVGIGAYSVAHGATAFAAGLLARALAANPTGGERHAGDELGSLIDRLDPADLVFLGLIATGVKALASVSLTFFEARAGGLVGDCIRDRTIAALLQKGARFDASKTLATVSSRCRDVEQAAISGVLHGTRAVAQLVPLALALILMSPRLALVGTVALLPFAWALTKLRSLWRGTLSRAQTLHDELLIGVDDLIANLDLWRSYSAGTLARAAVARASRLANTAKAKADAGRAALSGFNEILGVLALFGCIALAPLLGGEAIDGTLLGFAVVFFMAYRPLRDLGDARGWLLKGTLALEAVAGLTKTTEPAVRSSGRLARPAPLDSSSKPDLQLREFGACRVRQRVTLEAPYGEIVAIVGPTGSGKTSLLRAMLGLEPAYGELRFGGHDLSVAAIGPPERPFAWVPQDAPLVGDTLLGNVALFSNEERARAALASIGADQLVDALGTTRVGPGGRPLSGGERRLVSLARALASGQPVLLLDEPTAGLDPATQKLVLEALCQLRRQRTLLVVTHRIEVQAIADRVIELTRDGSSNPPLRSHVA